MIGKKHIDQTIANCSDGEKDTAAYVIYNLLVSAIESKDIDTRDGYRLMELLSHTREHITALNGINNQPRLIG